MNRKLNAAITAGLSLSMVLGSTPVTAIAAQVKQPAAKGATDEADYCSITIYDSANGAFAGMVSAKPGEKVTDALERATFVEKPGYKMPTSSTLTLVRSSTTTRQRIPGLAPRLR